MNCEVIFSLLLPFLLKFPTFHGYVGELCDKRKTISLSTSERVNNTLYMLWPLTVVFSYIFFSIYIFKINHLLVLSGNCLLFIYFLLVGDVLYSIYIGRHTGLSSVNFHFIYNSTKSVFFFLSSPRSLLTFWGFFSRSLLPSVCVSFSLYYLSFLLCFLQPFYFFSTSSFIFPPTMSLDDT